MKTPLPWLCLIATPVLAFGNDLDLDPSARKGLVEIAQAADRLKAPPQPDRTARRVACPVPRATWASLQVCEVRGAFLVVSRVHRHYYDQATALVASPGRVAEARERLRETFGERLQAPASEATIAVAVLDKYYDDLLESNRSFFWGRSSDDLEGERSALASALSRHSGVILEYVQAKGPATPWK